MMPKILDKMTDYKSRLALPAALCAAIAVSIGPILVRLSEIGPAATAFNRFFLSLPFLIVWMIIDNSKQDQTVIPHRVQDYLRLFTAGSLLALDICIWYWSLNHTTIINATLLNNMTVIIVPLMAWLLCREKPAIYLIIGVVLSIIGSSILVGHSFSFDPRHLVGDCQALISALFYSVFLLIVKKLRHQFSAVTIMVWGAIPSLYILAIISYCEGTQIFPQTGSGWLCLVGLAFIVHILGQGLLTYAIAHLSASMSALIMSLVPVFSAGLGWIIVDESLSALQIFGATVVLVGIIIAQKVKFTALEHKE